MSSKEAVDELLRSAEQALRLGRLDEAADAYRTVVAAAPDRAEAWFNLGWTERARRRFDEALDAYAAALNAGIERPEDVHLNRAAILSDQLFRPAEAEAELRSALAANPRFPPALLSLGNLYEDAARFDEARATYRQLLEIEPGSGRARARLAMLDLRDHEPGKVAAELTRMLDRAPTLEDRSEMLFALASVLEAAERYTEAFQAQEAANLLALSASAQRYDPNAFERLVDRLIAAFPDKPSVTGEAEPPVFILGMFRSGSTLAEQMLSRHSRLRSGGELEAIPALAAALPGYPEAAGALTNGQLAAMRRSYAQEAARLGTGAQLLDKRCDNFLHIGLIKTLFPDARIIHTVRQPLDNLLSIAFLRFGEGVTYGHRFEDSAHHYVHYRRLMDHWRSLFGEDIHELSYDALVREPEPVLRAALDALGLPFEPGCLKPEQAEGPVRTASALQVRQPLHRRSSGRWHHYADQLAPVRSYLEANGVAVA